MGRQPRTRKRTAQVLTSIEQRRLKLQEEIRALEAQPESPSTTKSLTTKRRLLANVDKERYNWLGLEDEEELGTLRHETWDQTRSACFRHGGGFGLNPSFWSKFDRPP